MKLNEIFIMRKGGVTVFYHNFGSETLDKDLLTGVMAALRMMASEITGKELKNLVLSDRRYSFFSFDQFTLVIHSGEDCSSTEIARFAAEIGQAFDAKYGMVLESTFNLEQFDPFSQELNAILSIEDPKTTKTGLKSSEALANFLGLTKGKINMKRVLDNL